MKLYNGELAIQYIVHTGVDKLYDIRIHRDTRSKKANRYFHRLVKLLADGERVGFFQKKNELIVQYGNHEFERSENGELCYEYLDDNDNWKHHETKHFMPTEYTDTFRGREIREFVLLKGTHTYNSKEMYHLIECTRNECLGCGIAWEDVATFEEQQLMGELNGDRV